MKMTLDGVKCFIAQVVLNLAGIMQSNLPADPQIHEQLTQKGMTFVDMGGDGQAFLREMNVIVLIDRNQPVLTHLTQNNGHGWP